MVIAIPTENKMLSEHFGHCEKFSFYVIENNSIIKEYFLKPPAHEPGVLPSWLKENNTDLVLAAGMGNGAINLFKKNDIDVKIGIPPKETKAVVKSYLNGSLESVGNYCNH